jgi:hypothetical protein
MECPPRARRPESRYGGAPVTFEGPKPRALLVELLLHLDAGFGVSPRRVTTYDLDVRVMTQTVALGRPCTRERGRAIDLRHRV